LKNRLAVGIEKNLLAGVTAAGQTTNHPRLGCPSA